MRASSTCTPASARRSASSSRRCLLISRGVAAQRELAFLVLVVGIAGGHRAQRRFGLDVHEAFVVVDVEHGLGRIDHLPDDDRRDLDRVAVEVVDLELAALEVAHALADLLLGVEGVVPAQAVLVDRADVLAEQAQHRGLVGLDHVEAEQAEERQAAEQQAADGHAGRQGVGLRTSLKNSEAPTSRRPAARAGTGMPGGERTGVLFHGSLRPGGRRK